MTSGTFGSIEISQITVNRELRQRRELDDKSIEEMAESLHKRGQIHPILLDRELTLVAGERRLEAAKRLGWTRITFQYTDEVDPIELQLLELEENVKRLDLPWQDQVRAVQRYHHLKAEQAKEKGEEWSESSTARELGVTPMDVSRKMRIAEGMDNGDERIINAPKLSVARGIIERGEARKAASIQEIQALESVIGPREKQQVVFNDDFAEWVKTYTGPKFNFLHCDFPYGIGAEDFNQGGAAAHGGYEDSPDTYFGLIQTLLDNFERVCSPSCHIMFWFSMKFYNETLFLFDKSPFKLDRFPLIWHRSDNAGILPDPKRGPRRVYETCLYGSAGDRLVNRAVSNLFPCETVRERHMSEKPERMLKHFFQMFVDENTVMLDPTCGSGSSLRAARAMRASHYIGLEINPEFAKLAQEDFDASAL